MRRSWLIVLGLLPCLALVLTAMAWLSLTAVRLALEEQVRLALWRADSTLAPLVAQESVRPWFAYRAFLPADHAYQPAEKGDGRLPAGERLLPSPLLTGRLPNVLVHFQFEPDGRLTSPQIPRPENWKLAVPRYVEEESVGRCRENLKQVESLAGRSQLLALLPPCPSQPLPVITAAAPLLAAAPPASGPTPEPQQVAAQQQAEPWNEQQMLPIQSPLRQSPQQREFNRNRRNELQQRGGKGVVDYDLRNSLLTQNAANPNSFYSRSQDQDPSAQGQQRADPQSQSTGYNMPLAVLPSSDISGMPMTPLCVGGQLMLARRIVIGGREYVQGCLLDWPSIETALRETVDDLLPEARFEPVEEPPQDPSRMLASLPIRLLPGRWFPNGDAATSPILLSLALAWACVLVAAVAVAGLLRGVIRLSERRASFVTAVTHELRTPLTTFQMYAEMLAEGMVTDPSQQRHYLGTLRTEALRLTHLVENVLSYARLERGRIDRRLESLPLGELVDRMADRLAARASQTGMELVVAGEPDARAATVRANGSAVEQILFNLVDNACKYAAAAEDRRLELTLHADAKTAELRLRDYGPGVASVMRRRLFRPFSKSAREAAVSAPGVGLGLALSRRLARDMGGELRYEPPTGGGACFVLTLPLQPPE